MKGLVTMVEPDPVGAQTATTSRLALIGAAGFVLLAMAWFAVSLICLNASVVDALSEALGGVMLVALVVSIVGSLGQTR